MEEGGLAAGSAAAARGAWTVFEDEAGQSLTPPRARTWGRVGRTPVLRVQGRGSGRIHVYRGRKEERRGFTWTDYRDLIIRAHLQLWVTGFMPTFEVVKGALTACDMDIYAHFLEQPGHLRASIEWFATLPQDVKNDVIYQKTKLRMPVLAIGASANLGSREATWVRKYATNVTGVVIPNSGHWMYEEHPAELTRILLQFLG